MSDRVPPSAGPPEELQVLAGEYVLGTLDAAEMRAVRRRAAEDGMLATAIAAWERRLLPLAAAVPPVAPPPALWERIEQAVAPLPQEPAEPALRALGPPALVAPPDRLGAPDRIAPAPQSPRRRVWPWQLATVASLALAAGLAGFAFLPRPPEPPQVAALVPSGGAQPAFVVQAQPDGSAVIAAVAPQPVPPGHDLELWMLPRGASTPVPAGLVPATGTPVKLPEAPAPGTQLMISLEPAGGAPGNAPTGPVLYQGAFGPGV